MEAKGAPPPPPPPTPPNPNPNGRAFVGPSARARAIAAAAEDSGPPPSKPMLAFYFLRALSRIRGVTPVRRRTRTIRRAAYCSMARAASPRRTWSQALLRQARARRSASSRRAAVLMRRRVVGGAAPATAAARSGGGTTTAGGETSAAAAAVARAPPPPRQGGEPSRTDALRRLVPGGAGMEYCSLLEETADYVRCLRAQVQLMQGLADVFSCQ